jgi:ATP-binding cassette subfamily B protein
VTARRRLPGVRLTISMTLQAGRWRLVAYVLAVVAIGVVPVGAAWTTKVLLDRLSHRQEAAATAGSVVSLAIGLAVLSGLALVLPHTLRHVQEELGRSIRIAAQSDLYLRVNLLPGLGSFENPEFLNHLYLARQVAQASLPRLFIGVSTLLQGTATLVSFLVTLAVLSPAMVGLVLLAAVPVAVTELFLGRRRARGAWQISTAMRREMFYASLLTDLNAVKELRIFGAGTFMHRRMMAELRSISDAQRRLSRGTATVQSGLSALTGVVSGLGLCWAATEAFYGRLGAGDVVLFVSAIAAVQSGIAGVIGQVSAVHESMLMLGHYRAVTETPPAAPATPAIQGHRPLPPLVQGIEFDDVWFRYRHDGEWTLREVNLSIQAGHRVALVGLNGAGKSTLVKLLCRLYEPTRGAIRWDGVDLREIPVEELRARLSVVFQDYMAYDLSVLDNIALGEVGPDDRDRVRAAAERAGIHPTLARLPDGYDTTLSRVFVADPGEDSGVTLSGGQWQRLALARGLIRDSAELLILDEPSAGLDAAAEHEVHRSLATFRVGRTTLLISHRLSAVRDADTILVLAGGHIVEEGDHRSLMDLGGVYAELFSLQASGYADTPA